MSVAYYIVCEQELDDLDTFVNGKAIAKVSDKALQKLCADAGIQPLEAFISADPEDLAEFLEDEGVEESGDLPAEQWFAAAEGLQWTQSLMKHLQAHPEALKNAEDVLSDLAEYELVFQALVARNVRWHFALDF